MRFPDVPPAPCDTCHKRALCARDQLACPAYTEYVREGEPEHASMVPTNEEYKKIFSGRFLIEREVE